MFSSDMFRFFTEKEQMGVLLDSREALRRRRHYLIVTVDTVNSKSRRGFSLGPLLFVRINNKQQHFLVGGSRFSTFFLGVYDGLGLNCVFQFCPAKLSCSCTAFIYLGSRGQCVPSKKKP